MVIQQFGLWFIHSVCHPFSASVNLSVIRQITIIYLFLYQELCWVLSMRNEKGFTGSTLLEKIDLKQALTTKGDEWECHDRKSVGPEVKI